MNMISDEHFFVASMKRGESCPFYARRLEVIQWLSLGKTASEIAEIMGTTKWTIQTHISVAKEITGAANSVSLVARALREGWIQ